VWQEKLIPDPMVEVKTEPDQYKYDSPLQEKNEASNTTLNDPYLPKTSSEYEYATPKTEEITSTSFKNDNSSTKYKEFEQYKDSFIQPDYKPFTNISQKSGNESEEPPNQVWDLSEFRDKRFNDRDEMIDQVRDVAKSHGFNIWIPRGDITLNDGTWQTTLYWDKYGNKRKRTQDGKERYSKKTNCKWKMKFQRKGGEKWYEMVQSNNNQHNHYLNHNISKKKKSNKLQGKRSHVKYREMQEKKKSELNDNWELVKIMKADDLNIDIDEINGFNNFKGESQYFYHFNNF